MNRAFPVNLAGSLSIAVGKQFHATGAARLVGAARGVEPHVRALDQMAHFAYKLTIFGFEVHEGGFWELTVTST